MNYNEEMAVVFDSLGLGYKLDEIKEEDKAKPEDYINIENKLILKEEENRHKFNSLGKESLPCLSLGLDRRKKWKSKKQ